MIFVSEIKTPSNYSVLFFLLALEALVGGLYYLDPILSVIPIVIVVGVISIYYGFIDGPFFWLIFMIIASGLNAWGVIGGGVTLFHVTWVMAIGSVIYSSLFHHKRQINLGTPINNYIFAFWGISFISLFYTPNLQSGVLDLMSTISLFAVYVFFVNFVKSRNQFLAVIWTLLIANVFNSFLTFYQIMYENILYVGSATTMSTTGEKIWRANGTFEDPNVLASFLIMGVILAVGLALFADISKKHKLAFSLSAIISIFGILATFSRSGWLALLIGLGVLLLFHKNKRIVFSVVFFSSLSFLLIIFLSPYGDFILGRFDTILNLLQDDSIKTRMGMALSGIEMFKDAPIFGLGLRAYPVLYDFYIEALTPGTLLYVKESHTLYITLLAELGIIGFLIVFFWFKRVILDSFKMLKKKLSQFDRAIVISNFSVFISFIITFFVYGNLFPGFNLFWINLALIYSMYRKTFDENNELSEGK